ncbi:hypothetical protein M885DRAFT_505757 [Pelagophyceae sp. CCMP2097]|nr:hypothetical protein M885DRAFT_505757 [Pelagophyceae sp. CCMP2097]
MPRRRTDPPTPTADFETRHSAPSRNEGPAALGAAARRARGDARLREALNGGTTPKGSARGLPPTSSPPRRRRPRRRRRAAADLGDGDSCADEDHDAFGETASAPDASRADAAADTLDARLEAALRRHETAAKKARLELRDVRRDVVATQHDLAELKLVTADYARRLAARPGADDSARVEALTAELAQLTTTVGRLSCANRGNDEVEVRSELSAVRSAASGAQLAAEEAGTTAALAAAAAEDREAARFGALVAGSAAAAKMHDAAMEKLRAETDRAVGASALKAALHEAALGDMRAQQQQLVLSVSALTSSRRGSHQLEALLDEARSPQRPRSVMSRGPNILTVLADDAAAAPEEAPEEDSDGGSDYAADDFEADQASRRSSVVAAEACAAALLVDKAPPRLFRGAVGANNGSAASSPIHRTSSAQKSYAPHERAPSRGDRVFPQ